ncbi:TIGR01777 family oxidoreductase [Phytomonospora endophytica]|uniref:TIGR01777 family protein n=1 Tax=Phytomonospora endophytica TaxID=714109 RepID=A0A841G0P5_9ACTN|nr:TIGR01777 family oxidoreductase [Phytomonospora endophytica]MBB6039498.1 hypothetical protein [Phytomonospora endophytica]
MKVVIPGGTGPVGAVLTRALLARGHEIVHLSRRPRADAAVRTVAWDGRGPGPWTAEIDGCDAVVNLAGRSVSCRYTPENLREMMDSRVDSTRAVGAAIAAATNPPPVWLQMSTATIYAHTHAEPNDDSGVIGGEEPGVPAYWAFSVDIARAWERAQAEADTPATRKVALRAAMVMSRDKGSVFDTLLRMTRLGLGGPVAGGRQFISWIHAEDFARAVAFLIDRDDIDGTVNVAAPGPLPQREFMRHLRAAAKMPVGLPATRWMAELGALAMRSDTELLLKSRRVVPRRLPENGFDFAFPEWPEAAADLVGRAER